MLPVFTAPWGEYNFTDGDMMVLGGSSSLPKAEQLQDTWTSCVQSQVWLQCVLSVMLPASPAWIIHTFTKAWNVGKANSTLTIWCFSYFFFWPTIHKQILSRTLVCSPVHEHVCVATHFTKPSRVSWALLCSVWFHFRKTLFGACISLLITVQSLKTRGLEQKRRHN